MTAEEIQREKIVDEEISPSTLVDAVGSLNEDLSVQIEITRNTYFSARPRDASMFLNIGLYESDPNYQVQVNHRVDASLVDAEHTFTVQRKHVKTGKTKSVWFPNREFDSATVKYLEPRKNLGFNKQEVENERRNERK